MVTRRRPHLTPQWGPPNGPVQRIIGSPPNPARFAVVDCETTGLYNSDRVIEVAVVVVDLHSSQIVDEYDTLINPMRDTGPVGIHGITPSMVQLAPTFDEVAAAVAQRVEGSVLVAHNLQFDARMLRHEYDRLGAQFDAGKGICTLRLTGERLNLACARYGIQLMNHHRALADARATAELLIKLTDEDPGTSQAHITDLAAALSPRTHRRDATGIQHTSSVLERLIAGAPYPTSDEALLSYLDTLDWVLDDLVITAAESSHLQHLAVDLGLTPARVHAAHETYLELMIRAARRDSVITEDEHEMLERVAGLLGIASVPIPVTSVLPQLSAIPTGATICFTGAMSKTRDALETMAVRAGLRPLDNVTKLLKVLVAADPASQSGKAKKARQYGIPVISEDAFLKQLG